MQYFASFLPVPIWRNVSIRNVLWLKWRQVLKLEITKRWGNGFQLSKRWAFTALSRSWKSGRAAFWRVYLTLWESKTPAAFWTLWLSPWALTAPAEFRTNWELPCRSCHATRHFPVVGNSAWYLSSWKSQGVDDSVLKMSREGRMSEITSSQTSPLGTFYIIHLT